MRLLFVNSRPPWPPRRGDQARTAGLVSQLVERHEVRVVALRPRGFEADAPHGVRVVEVPLSPARMLASLLAHPLLPWQVALHDQRTLRRRVNAEVAQFRPDVAVVVLSRLGGVLPALGTTPVVVDLIDALELNMRNRAARQPLLAAPLVLEARRMGRWDRALVERVAAATVVAERDRRAVAGSDAELGRRVHVVPFGIRVPAATPAPGQRRPVVLLSGNLGYFPTVDGALWFGREVWPRVRAQRPDAEWWLAGARPAGPVRTLAHAPGVRLIEDPADLAAIRAEAAVTIAPMRSGSGTPIKVLEAMAEGVPVVATSAAAGGLDDVTPVEIAIGDDPLAFARAVTVLLADPARAGAQASAAWSWVRQRHDLAAVAARFETILVEAASGVPL